MDNSLNFELFKYSMELVFDEERKQKERLKKRQDMMNTKIKGKRKPLSYIFSNTMCNVLFFVIIFLLWYFLRDHVWAFVVPFFKGNDPSLPQPPTGGNL